MQTTLDILGSMFLFGILVLSMTTLNAVAYDSLYETNISSIAQEDLTDVERIADYDFLKIGYRKSGTKLDTSRCSSSSVMWYTDANRDGVIDTVGYFIAPSDSTILYRNNNGTSEIVRPGVISFGVSYYDSTGTPLSPPTGATSAARVRGIGIRLHFRVPDYKLPGKENEAYLDKRWFPRSLQP